MPVLFRTLPKEELGVWLLLGQSWAVLGIFDLGFGATLTRRIAFASSRAATNGSLNAESIRELADLVATGRRVYCGLAVFAFIFSFIAGFFYLQTLDLSAVALWRVWLAWGILCLSQAVSVRASVWNCVLQGVGYVGWDTILSSISGALALAAQILVVICGGGLVSLATVAAGGALVQRFLSLGFARHKRPDAFSARGNWNSALFRSMISPALRAWFTSFGLLLALNTDQFLVARLKGASELPAYRGAYILFLNLNVIAVTVSSASSVFIAQLWQEGNRVAARRIVMRNVRLALLLMGIGGATVLGLGGHLFRFWLGPENFVGYPILCVFFLLMFLEAQCFTITSGSRATEDEAFASWTLTAGVLKILLSLFLVSFWGLFGIAVATLIAQLTTNHWFMVTRGLSRLEIGLKEHLIQNIAPVVAIGITAFAIVRCACVLLNGYALSITVITGLLFGSAILGLSLWFLVLEEEQRLRLIKAKASLLST